MSERFERRIRELKAAQAEDGATDMGWDVPIRNTSIEAARHFLHEPLVSVGPNGDVYLDWRWPDGASLVMQFREGQSPNWAGRPNRSVSAPIDGGR